MLLVKFNKSRHKSLEAGTKFGKLTVLTLEGYLKKTGNKKYFEPVYKCLCDCGNEVLIERVRFKYGNTTSCGCVRKENVYDRHAKKRLQDDHTFYRQKLFNDYLKKAKTRKHEFSITFDEFSTLTNKPCHYCKRLPYTRFPSKVVFRDYILYNGLDRKNNNLGYLSKNVVPCCKECNFLKGTFDYNIFINLVNLISKNMGSLSAET